jgi:hypothetical protein
MVIAKAKAGPHILELHWAAFLGADVPKAKAARKKSASKKAVNKKPAKAVGRLQKKESKLVEDEEAMAAEAEPMGSVAAAVARDQGSAAPSAKVPAHEPSKPKEKFEGTAHEARAGSTGKVAPGPAVE